MSRRASRGLVAIAALATLAGCATPPPPSAVPLAFPAPGTTWTTRTLDARGVTTATWRALEAGTFEDRPVFRVAVGPEVRLYDRATANWVATLRDGEVGWTALPHAGTFAWPLTVGRGWMTTTRFHDRARGLRTGPVVTFWVVETYEDVEVPAGGFKAFRLVGSPGMNNGTYTTLWYAPALSLVVREVREETATTEGQGGAVTELVTYRGPETGARTP